MNQKGGTRTDTVVKLVLIFFISLLSFSVGTFVGKQVSDSDYRRAALENDFNNANRATASVEDEVEEPANKAALTDEDIASLTDEFVQKEKEKMQEEVAEKDEMGDKKPIDIENDGKEYVKLTDDGYKKLTKAEKRKLAPKMAFKLETVKAEREPSSAATRVAGGKAPTPDAKEMRKPDSTLPSVATSSVGKYTIQIASYTTEEEAKTHVNKLKAQGYSAFYVPAKIKGNQWYRVSVGLFENQNSAKKFRAELMKDAGIKSSIIQKIIK